MNTVLRFAILQQNILEIDIYFTKHFGTFRFFAMLYTPRLQIQSKQCANPRRQRRYRRKDYKQLQQLAYNVEAILPPFHHMCHLGVIMLEKVKLQKQKVVNEGHVANLINGED